LSSGYTKLQDEFDGLRDAAKTLKWEIVEAKNNREAKVADVRTKFQDYRPRYRMNLCNLQFHLKKVVNEFGARCLPFPRKSSTLSDMIGWVDNEIQANCCAAFELYVAASPSCDFVMSPSCDMFHCIAFVRYVSLDHLHAICFIRSPSGDLFCWVAFV
jgi:hypothetical protein